MPALAELAEFVYQEWGSPRQLISDMVAEWKEGGQGSIARQRTGAAIMALLTGAAKQQEQNRQSDELLSEEDLKAEFYELMGIDPKSSEAGDGEKAAANPAEESEDGSGRAGAQGAPAVVGAAPA